MAHLKLVYFDCRARAEAARLMLHFRGIQFEDVRVTNEEWPALKPSTPYGQLPVLEIDGRSLAQTAAIDHYVARLTGFDGRNDIERAFLEQVYDLFFEFYAAVLPYYRVRANIIKGDENALRQNQFKPNVEKYLPLLIDELKSSGFFGESGVSYVDFVVSETIDTFYGFAPEIIGMYEQLLQHSKRVHNLPELQQYLKTRPITEC